MLESPANITRFKASKDCDHQLQAPQAGGLPCWGSKQLEKLTHQFFYLGA